MLFNVNHYVRVRLNDHGRNIHRDYWKPHTDALGHVYHPPEEDADGWSKWQMWELMQLYGQHMRNGSNVPFNLEIEIVENQSS